MPFQFYCPGGHLLEGTEAQMGQQCQCPICSVAFIVPTIGDAPPAPALVTPASYVPPMPEPSPPPAGFPASFPEMGPRAQGALALVPGKAAAAEIPTIVVDPAAKKAADDKKPPEEKSAAEPAKDEKPAEDPHRVVRIPCPQGHELETPMSMIGMDAMCPHCGEQFTLLYENSVECREEQTLKRQRREEEFTRRLVQWSIVGGVVILIGFIVLIVVAATR